MEIVMKIVMEIVMQIVMQIVMKIVVEIMVEICSRKPVAILSFTMALWAEVQGVLSYSIILFTIPPITMES